MECVLYHNCSLRGKNLFQSTEGSVLLASEFLAVQVHSQVECQTLFESELAFLCLAASCTMPLLGLSGFPSSWRLELSDLAELERAFHLQCSRLRPSCVACLGMLGYRSRCSYLGKVERIDACGIPSISWLRYLDVLLRRFRGLAAQQPLLRLLWRLLLRLWERMLLTARTRSATCTPITLCAPRLRQARHGRSAFCTFPVTARTVSPYTMSPAEAAAHIAAAAHGS